MTDDNDSGIRENTLGKLRVMVLFLKYGKKLVGKSKYVERRGERELEKIIGKRESYHNEYSVLIISFEDCLFLSQLNEVSIIISGDMILYFGI